MGLKTTLRTSVSSTGTFRYLIHKPAYTSINLREGSPLMTLGHMEIKNEKNLPKIDVTFPERKAKIKEGWVYEIPNAFPFMGATFIQKDKADQYNPEKIIKEIRKREEERKTEPKDNFSFPNLSTLPQSVKIALAQTSKNPELLTELAKSSCEFEYDNKGIPAGIKFLSTERMAITNHAVFEITANNPYLPEDYKKVMVLNPGAQGSSEIVGDYSAVTNIFEYLRTNSYIPWGHYAANMAHNFIRYKAGELTEEDIRGLRHLYYQRIYIQLAHSLEIPIASRKSLTVNELEELRKTISQVEPNKLFFNATIWGQNFGYDFSPSGHKLHASHQQIHQQYALIPAFVPISPAEENESSPGYMPSYVQGDNIAEFCEKYASFFENYIKALTNNVRIDGQTSKPQSLIIHQDGEVILLVPKAQRSPWELQIMTLNHAGNILETDTSTRESIDRQILKALQILEACGASLITAYEISKRFNNVNSDQRLIYTFLPRVPGSPSAWQEFQNRWIVSHYPEDFAQTCREIYNEFIRKK